MKKRGCANEETPGQWTRILWPDQEIRAGSYPNVEGLQAKFEVSRRTAFNTVTFLRYSLNAPVRYRKNKDKNKKSGYYYEDPTYGLPSVFLREG